MIKSKPLMYSTQLSPQYSCLNGFTCTIIKQLINISSKSLIYKLLIRTINYLRYRNDSFSDATKIPLQYISLVLFNDNFDFTILTNMPCIRTDCISTFYDTIFNICVISNMYIIQYY